MRIFSSFNELYIANRDPRYPSAREDIQEQIREYQQEHLGGVSALRPAHGNGAYRYENEAINRMVKEDIRNFNDWYGDDEPRSDEEKETRKKLERLAKMRNPAKEMSKEDREEYHDRVTEFLRRKLNVHDLRDDDGDELEEDLADFYDELLEHGFTPLHHPEKLTSGNIYDYYNEHGDSDKSARKLGKLKDRGRGLYTWTKGNMNEYQKTLTELVLSNYEAKAYNSNWDSDSSYLAKDRLVEKLCELSKKMGLDYGYKNGVMYFDTPCNQQISFHVPRLEENPDELKKIPRYRKAWDGQYKSALNKLRRELGFSPGLTPPTIKRDTVW